MGQAIVVGPISIEGSFFLVYCGIGCSRVPEILISEVVILCILRKTYSSVKSCSLAADAVIANAGQ